MAILFVSVKPHHNYEKILFQDVYWKKHIKDWR